MEPDASRRVRVLAGSGRAYTGSPGIEFTKRGEPMVTKGKRKGTEAPADGLYELDGKRYGVSKGGFIPEGGTFHERDKRVPPKRGRFGSTLQIVEANQMMTGEQIAQALEAAGYQPLLTNEEVAAAEPLTGEDLAELLRESGYELTRPAPAGPSETTESAGPVEATGSGTPKKKD